MPTVTLAFSAIPGHVRTARLVAATVARRAGIDDALLDEVRLAVGEACSRAVGLHREHAPEVPIEVSLSDEERFTIRVRDRGPAGAEVAGSGLVEAVELVDPSELGAPTDAQASVARDEAPEHLPGGFGLAVIAGLVDDLEVEAPDDGGTSVCMSWPLGPHPDLGEPTG
jgi:anti-sigma regulatory factor (Ser/Thr protein kinase)